MAIWRQPRTPIALAIVNLLFGSMVPTPDFPARKCLALRQAFVPRLERIEEANLGTAATICDAIRTEYGVARNQPDHPLHNGTTNFVRYLNAYAIEVEGTRGCRLVEPDDEVYYDFAHHIVRAMAIMHAIGGGGSEEDGSESDAGSSSSDAGR